MLVQPCEERGYAGDQIVDGNQVLPLVGTLKSNQLLAKVQPIVGKSPTTGRHQVLPIVGKDLGTIIRKLHLPIVGESAKKVLPIVGNCRRSECETILTRSHVIVWMIVGCNSFD